jgi:ABC-type transport system involved in cytochrome bd biosynthesis fused ATPase/permease subunit
MRIRGGKELRRALSQAGLRIEATAFADGLETMLSTEFGRVDLSGGEWQRVSIAC